jgi:signal transduction histidine kinase
MYILNKIHQSLSLKLSIGILLMAIPVFVISLGILFLCSRSMVREESEDRVGSVLNATVQRVRSYLGTVETATESNSWFVLDNMHPDSLLAISRRVVLFNPHTDGCSVTTEPNTFPEYGRYFSAYTVRDGKTVTTVREAEYEYFVKDWYRIPVQLGKACWIDPFDDYNEGTLSAQSLIASYCKPLYRNDGRLLGVISTDLSLQRLSETIQSEHPYEHSYFMMIGQDGRFFIHPDSTRLFVQTIFSGVDPRQHSDLIALGHEMTAGGMGNMRVIIDEVPCLVSYQSVPGTRWSLALVCPQRDVLGGYYHLGYLLIPLLLFGMLIILLLSRKAVAIAIRPLNQLLSLSQKIAAGHYDEKIAHTSRQDAVGRLQNSFATMQESLVRHVADIQQANEEMRQRNEELTKATQMAKEAAEQKIVFIQNVTHQIRTPLNIVMGFAQVLRDSIKQMPKEEVKNVAAMMEHSATTLSRMVLMLFDSSETGTSEEFNMHKHEPVSCNDVARESLEFSRHHFPDKCFKFETSVPDSFCIHTNRLYLMRGLREILYNAGKYSDGKHILLSIEKTDTVVRFVFEDTGVGIAEENREKMFEMFVKFNDLSEGLGLGLPLSKRHIDNLGGSLTLDTNYHDGCRFIVELPI